MAAGSPLPGLASTPDLADVAVVRLYPATHGTPQGLPGPASKEVDLSAGDRVFHGRGGDPRAAAAQAVRSHVEDQRRIVLGGHVDPRGDGSERDGSDALRVEQRHADQDRART